MSALPTAGPDTRALSAHTVGSLRVPGPGYDRGGRTSGIVHLGVGGFHRSHQADYLDRLAALEDLGAWAIMGAELLADRVVHDALTKQDHLYTLVLKHPDGHWEPRVVGSLADHIQSAEEPGRLIDVLSSRDTRIVTLTITEGGYGFDPRTGEFSPSDADTLDDLAGGFPARSALGVLASALGRRRANGTPPFTVVSCDNVVGNGDVAKAAMNAFVSALDPALADWIDEHVSFPNSMVDRITPVTTAADRDELEQRYGVRDLSPVMAEPFCQWILEDAFPLGRPPLEKVGVQFVSDVRPYELMKLRLLNAGHQVLTYIGIAAGHTYVHDAVGDDRIRRTLRRYLVEEATPTLSQVDGIDLGDYAETLLDRFSNPGLGDTLARNSAFGSDRIQTFVLPVIRDRLGGGHEAPVAVATVVAWARFVRSALRDGGPSALVDNRAAILAEAVDHLEGDPFSFLRVAGIFGDLAHSPVFVRAFSDALAQPDPYSTEDLAR